MQLPVNFHLMLFVFCATLCSYNFHYLLGNVLAGRALSIRILKAKATQVMFLLLGALGALLLYAGTQLQLHNLAIAFLLTFLYSVPLLTYNRLSITRKAGFIKTILLAFTWMFVTAYLPMAHYHLQFTSLGLLLLLKRFLFMLMLCILFDNRDAAIDKIHGLSSLATVLSPQMMKWLIYLLFIGLFVLNFMLGQHGITIQQRIALQLVSFITLIVYYLSRQKRGYFFYYFMVDGLMFLSASLVTIASI